MRQTWCSAEGPGVSADEKIQIKVWQPGGRVVSHECSIADLPSFSAELKARGGRLLSATRRAPSTVRGKNSTGQDFPLTLFSQELLALTEAGLNLMEALETLRTKENRLPVKQVLDDLVQSLTRGQSFGEALSTQAHHFPDMFVATVRASEQTGDLPKALSRYISYQIQLEAIRKKLIAASIYPVVLFLVGALVTLFLLGYVVPRFAAVYDTTGKDIPWMSLQLLHWGKWLNGHAVEAATFTLIGLTLAVGLLRRPASVVAVVHLVSGVPGVWQRIRGFRLSRFYRALGMLLASGVPMSRALEMSADLLMPDQRVALGDARAQVLQGERLSRALKNFGLTTAVAESLMQVGERSGQMAEMLERTAKFEDEEFARWIDWSSRLIEPLLMTVMGLLIGGVVLLLYMPIFDLAGSVQ